MENGLTVFSAAALRRCAAVFPESRSGYGLDFVFAFLVTHDEHNVAAEPARRSSDPAVLPTPWAEPERRIAVVDAVRCVHPVRHSALDELVDRDEHRREAR